MIKLTLPWPPATNNLYRTLVLPGKAMPIRVPTGDLKKYKTAVKQICVDAEIQPIIGDVAITFHAFRPRRVGDLDGMLKAPFDALSGFAYIDDKQITEIEAKRFEDPKNPRVEIEIRALSLL
jgi:Holliday junction resolvase